MAARPSVDPNRLIAFRQYLNCTKALRDLATEEEQLVISTGNAPFDFVTGIGGFPRGRCCELWGKESSGKSTIALWLCKQELMRYSDSVVVYLDYERAAARQFCIDLGLIEFGDRFALINPATLEEGQGMIEGLYKAGIAPSIVVIDSVPAMSPQDLLDRDMADGAQPIGLQARKLSELLQNWTKAASDYNTLFLFLNQTRTFISLDRSFAGNKIFKRAIPGISGSEREATCGGQALKFYMSLRLHLDVKKVITGTSFNPLIGESVEVPIGNIVRITCAKNKLSSPYKQGDVYLFYGKGLDNVASLVDAGEKQGFIKKSGRGTFVLALKGRELKAVGEEVFIELLRSDSAAQKELSSLLQWDVADSVIKVRTEIKKVNITGDAEGEEENLKSSLKLLIEKGVTTSLVDQAPLLVHKAKLLGLIESPKSNLFLYTAMGEDQTRASTPENLDKKLTSVAKKELQGFVDEIYEVLKMYEMGVGGKEESLVEVRNEVNEV